jgi:iron complex outermembrane receptor protein
MIIMSAAARIDGCAAIASRQQLRPLSIALGTSMSLPNSGRLLLPVLLGSLPTVALAADAALTTAPVVVTATRVEQSGFDLPVSIDSLNKQQLQDGQLQVNLSESLARIPGIVAQNRQNYAQDLQISSRGFGARASFGVRGLRLYADGIPATMPDGQGQVSHIDLGSAARVEVMRGPFSALHGNSSGGVIAVFTEDGAPGMRIEPSLSVGSYGTERIATKLSGDTGTLNYVVNGARFSTDGYRDHSSATRQTLNAKLKWKPSADTGLTFTANSMEMPDLQDPLGLDRASYDANPRQATANAYVFNTRKSSSQQQLGLTLDQKVGADDTVSVMLYRGHRDTTQYQAITVGAQVASHPGGVIDLKRDYWGIDARWTHRGRLAGGPLTVTGGISYDDLDEARKGFQNFIGAQTGVLGALRRNEDNRIHSFDQYLQAQWEPSPAWLLMAGARHSAVKVSSKDKYIAVGNVDDSGSVDYAATTPVVGVTWRLSPALNLYASAGRGFETPTMNELSYRAGASGPNFSLRPSRSDNLEIGVKALVGQGAQLNAAIFTVKTRDELVTLQNTGGRAVFQNVGGTRRNGLELSGTADLGSHFQAAVAYSYLNAWYAEAFRSCTGTPCAVPNTAVAAGNLIPGIPRSSLFAELSWRHPASGFMAVVDARRVAKVFVNDPNTDAAEAYTVANLRLGFEQRSAGWTLKEFLRIDNLGDKKYSGSVIVNEGNSRFFEPAPERNYLVGITASYGF